MGGSGRFVAWRRTCTAGECGFEGTRLVGADVVEISPAYDHAEITAVAAANLVYEFCSLFALARR